MMAEVFDIFLVVVPGFEDVLADEARGLGFEVAESEKGGVTLKGGWAEVWRANLVLRGATRVLVRLASFPAVHLAQLDKRSRKLPWGDWLRADTPVRVEASCRRSKIYHDRAAGQRVERAITDIAGAPISKEGVVTVKLRIHENLCTFSLDTSGEALHRRGHKVQVNKAPMRETLAALFLRRCGYDGSGPVYDPMCGSGTFPIEAAEIALGRLPGRSRAFAFEKLASFDAQAFGAMMDLGTRKVLEGALFFGSDRDSGAANMSVANAERAGVDHVTNFQTKPISEIEPPTQEPGLVIVNPPYGGRIGNKKPLYGLYAGFGEVMKSRFEGWRVGLVTSEPSLAKVTGLPFDPPSDTIDHGGIRVRLWQAKI